MESKMKRRVFLIHGWGGFPEEGWRPCLKEKLIEKGFEVFNLAMPDTNNPICTKWVDYLQKSVVTPNSNDYFVGHSLGVITILRFLETFKKDQSIGGAILVAGFARDLEYTGYKGEVSSFFNTKLNWEKIRKVCQKFVVIHSDNDPYVPLKHNKIL